MNERLVGDTCEVCSHGASIEGRSRVGDEAMIEVGEQPEAEVALCVRAGHNGWLIILCPIRSGLT